MTDREVAKVLFKALAKAVDTALDAHAKARPVDNSASAGAVAVATVFGCLERAGYVMYKER